MSYITNKAGKYNFEIINTIRAGISLTGTEVKSIRNGKGSLVGAKVLIRGNEAFLVGANIPPHQTKNTPPSYDPERTRKLLINKKEIQRLQMEIEGKNLTIIPLTVYNCNRKLKVDVGIARKKNARDKREEIRKRDSERALRRSIKS